MPYSDEEKALIADIKTQIHQLEMMEQAESDTAAQMAKNEINKESKPMPISMADDKDDIGYTDEEKDLMKEMDEEGRKAYKSIRKSLASRGLTVAKAEMDEGTTARQTAEQRLEDDQPEQSMDNVTEVAKALLAAGLSESMVIKSIMGMGQKVATPKKATPVVKSVEGNRLDRIEGALTKLADVMKSIATQQDDVTEAVGNIFEGLGIAASVKKSIGADARQVNKSLTTPTRRVRIDTPSARAQVIKEIQDRRGRVETKPQTHGDVRKGLSDAMGMLFVGRN